MKNNRAAVIIADFPLCGKKEVEFYFPAWVSQ